MTILLWFVLVGGVFNIVFGLLMHTKNWQSAILFKILPFLFGLASVLYAVKEFHLI